MVRSSVTSRSKAALSARAKALSRSRSKLTISCSAALNGVPSLLFVWLRQRVEAIASAKIKEMIFIGLLLLGLRNNSDAQHVRNRVGYVNTAFFPNENNLFIVRKAWAVAQYDKEFVI